MKKGLITTLFFAFITSLALGQIPSIEEKTKTLDKTEGYFDYYWDEDAGKLWLEVDTYNTEFLYVNSLTAGIGSNDIGLDRGQLGDDRVVYFDKRGPKVLLVQPNYDYRAITDNKLEKKSVKEAFAQSVLWGFEVAAQSGNTVLIDLTDFLLRDAHGVSDRLKSQSEGNYSVDKSRSVLYKEATMNFPENTEFEALLTFKGNPSGRYLRTVVPSSEAITVRQHHSFIKLPDDNYEPRVFDPRSGFFGISYQDYATPIEENLVKRFISRHRLEKKNPDAEVSEAVEPIVYYLDNGTPEPVRSALLDGARWWAQAFEAIGYKNAYRVEIMPEDAHPMDVRYNVIQWVHRSTRGWSYGASVRDPRTGEIIKGHVSLGSLRVRQDFLIAEGLLAPYVNGDEDDPRMLEMALARIRQLSAHEVGHTIGIAHNFAASTNNRASVMDYPHPLIKMNGGQIDLNDAYDTGIGEWDKVAVAYGYQDFPDDVNEKEALNNILEEAAGEGLLYISDQDARPQGGAHPKAHLWDNNENAITELDRMMDIREKVLRDFGEANIENGEPLAKLEDVLVPMYLMHRYQVEAAVKLIGGLDYTYKLRGDNQQGPELVPAQTQRQAIQSMLNTLSPEALAVPEHLLELIPPRPSGIFPTRELFSGNTGPSLDAIGIANTTADMIAGLMLNPWRANRLIENHARSNDNPSLEFLIDELLAISWQDESPDGYLGSVHRALKYAVLDNLLELAKSGQANEPTKAVVHHKLTELQSELAGEIDTDADALYAFNLIERFMVEPDDVESLEVLPAPPGSPIGQGTIPLSCSFEH